MKFHHSCKPVCCTVTQQFGFAVRPSNLPAVVVCAGQRATPVWSAAGATVEALAPPEKAACTPSAAAALKPAAQLTPAPAADTDAGLSDQQCPADSPMPPAPPAMPAPALKAPQKAGTGRVPSKRSFVIDITAFERAELQWRAMLAAAAEAEFAKVKAAEQAAAAEAATRAAAEAEALQRAAEAAEAAARAAAEAEAAAKAAAEAEAAERAAAEQAAAEAAALAAAEAARQAEAEAAAAAAAAAAEAAAAEAAAAAAALESVSKTPAPKPSSSSMSISQWSPIEGVPELHTRPRMRRHVAAAAASAGLSSFTPMEGVPETARGFRRPQTSSGPGLRARVVFTPVEGVPEKALSFQKTPFERQLRRAAQQMGQQLQEAAAGGSSARDMAVGAEDSEVTTGAHTAPGTQLGECIAAMDFLDAAGRAV